MGKALVKQQFGANAAYYITSTPHAKGDSLKRLVDLVKPQAHWQVLDLATAAGHTAFAFAPQVAQVWATDITTEMLETATQQVQKRNLSNVINVVPTGRGGDYVNALEKLHDPSHGCCLSLEKWWVAYTNTGAPSPIMRCWPKP